MHQARPKKSKSQGDPPSGGHRVPKGLPSAPNNEDRRWRPTDEWAQKMQTDKKGEWRPNLHNCVLILTQSKEWRGVIGYNEFAKRIQVLKSMVDVGIVVGEAWSDDKDRLTRLWLHHKDLQVSKDTVREAIEVVAQRSTINPPREFLMHLKWDGTKRLDSWLMTYLGAVPDNEKHQQYLQAIGARWLIGAVARIMKPGCKLDTALVMEGPQGTYKSTAIRTLFDPWFSDDFDRFHGKDARMIVRGVWAIELSELSALGKSTVEAIKSFMSRQSDRGRDPYARRVTEFPRTVVFFGTSNSDAYLVDPTGGRRFWPFKTKRRVDIEGLKRDREQLFAEAYQAYCNSNPWWFTDDEADLIATARSEQAARVAPDSWFDVLEAWLADKNDVSVIECAVGPLGKTATTVSQKDQNRIAAILKDQGFEQFRANRSGKRPMRYRRIILSARRKV